MFMENVDGTVIVTSLPVLARDLGQDPITLKLAVTAYVIGLGVFMAAFVAMDKATPYDLWKEICEKQNRALAIVVGSVSLGICIIIAAAIHG